jgi:hypothetical protein
MGKILSEEENNELYWLHDLFNIYDIEMSLSFCTDDCDIKLEGNYLVLTITEDNFRDNILDVSDDDRYVLTPILYGYNVNDEYWLDDDEFNYAISYLSQTNIDKLREIMNLIGLQFENINDYRDNYENLHVKLNTVLDDKWFVDEYISFLSNQLNTNREKYIRHLFDEANKNLGIIFDRYRNDLKIKIPINLLNRVNSITLEDGLKKIFEPFNRSWYYDYYEHYDTTGSEEEINKLFGDYYDDVLEKLEDSVFYENFLGLQKILSDLGFTERSNLFSLHKNFKTYVIDKKDINYVESKLTLNVNREKIYKIPFDELSNYVLMNKIIDESRHLIYNTPDNKEVEEILEFLRNKYKIESIDVLDKTFLFISIDEKPLYITGSFSNKKLVVNKISLDSSDELKSYSTPSIRKAIKEFVNQNNFKKSIDV